MKTPGVSGGAIWRPAWIGLLVVLATFAIFSPTLGFEFIDLDNGDYVVFNPMVTNGFTRAGFVQAFTGSVASYWAPLLWLSYMLDHAWFGLAPWGFHLTNVLLFSLNAGLLFGLVWRWTGRTGPALAVALLWALHPARVESVAWITERKDVLSGLFFLLGAGAYVEGRHGNLRHGVFLAWVCMALGGLAKQILIVMPVALMLLDAWPLGRVRWGREVRQRIVEKWAFWLLAAALALLPIWLHQASGGLLRASLAQRLAMLPQHYLFYLQKVFWPVGLGVLQADLTFHKWGFALGFAILASVTWHVSRGRAEAPGVLMGWLWFVGLLLPLSGVVWVGAERIATRFLYLPQMGLTLAVVLAVDAAWQRRAWPPRRAAALGVLAIAACLTATLLLLPCWRNSQTLFLRVLRLNPQSLHAFDNLCGVYYQAGKYAEWQEVLDRFHREQPDNPVAGVQYAWWMAAMIGDPDRGIAAWERLTGLAPDNWDFWTKLERATPYANIVGLWQDVAGIWLRCKGDVKRMKQLREHWEGQWSERAQSNFLAEMLHACWATGRKEQAAALAAEIQALGKGWPASQQELLKRHMARWEQGARGYAFAGFKDYARWAPTDGAALNNMAWLLATATPDGLNHARMNEWPATALAWAEQALALEGGREIAGVWDTLAAARANTGDFTGAVAAAEQAVQLARRAGADVLAAEMQLRLETYRAGNAWREPDRRQQTGQVP